MSPPDIINLRKLNRGGLLSLGDSLGFLITYSPLRPWEPVGKVFSGDFTLRHGGHGEKIRFTNSLQDKELNLKKNVQFTN
jgi:hypothetical protein